MKKDDRVDVEDGMQAVERVASGTGGTWSGLLSPPGVLCRGRAAARGQTPGLFCPVTGVNDGNKNKHPSPLGVAGSWFVLTQWQTGEWSVFFLLLLPPSHCKHTSCTKYWYSEKVDYAIVLLRKSHFCIFSVG